MVSGLSDVVMWKSWINIAITVGGPLRFFREAKKSASPGTLDASLGRRKGYGSDMSGVGAAGGARRRVRHFAGRTGPPESFAISCTMVPESSP